MKTEINLKDLIYRLNVALPLTIEQRRYVIDVLEPSTPATKGEEEIKDGDWVFDTHMQSIHQAISGSGHVDEEGVSMNNATINGVKRFYKIISPNKYVLKDATKGEMLTAEEIEKEAQEYANGQLRLEGWVDDVALKAGFITGAKWHASQLSPDADRYKKLKDAFEELISICPNTDSDKFKKAWRTKAAL